MGWWKRAWRGRAADWVYGAIAPERTPDGLTHETVTADSAYLHVFVRAIRIVNSRKGGGKFFGAVHSFISLPHLGGDDAAFHVLTTPNELRDVDANHLDRVLLVNKRLLGPIPYRGGDIEFQIGLFSIKTADLLGPFLDVLSELSDAAGVSYVSTAVTFAKPMLRGLNALAGGSADTTLEIGIDRTFGTPETGYFAVVGANKGIINLADLSVDEDYRLLDGSGRPILHYPYMVLAVEATSKRDDWFTIPELGPVYQELMHALRGGHLEPANDAFAVFKRTVQTSPDLLPRDGDRLIAKVQREVERALGSTTTAATDVRLLELREIDLYG